MATAQAESTIPTGTWQSDPVHSDAGFAITHVVGTFRGNFEEFEATLSDGALTGRAPVGSVRVKDEDLHAHLLSPDFFDAESHPEIRFDSKQISVEDGRVVIDGELSLKGIAKPVVARGEISGPAPGPADSERLGLDLETTVDRRDFGLDWQLELPGGGKALGDEVTLSVHLELVRE